MWRFVVGHVLPREGQAVLRIVHQSVEPVFGWDGGGVKSQRLAIRRGHENLLTPVAKDVACEIWPTPGAAAFRSKDSFLRPGFPIPFRDRREAKELPEQISIPPDGPTVRAWFWTDVVALRISQAARPAPRFRPTMSRVSVSDEALANVHTGTVAPNRLTRTSIMNSRSRSLEAHGFIFIFADEKKFESRAVGIEIADV